MKLVLLALFVVAGSNNVFAGSDKNEVSHQVRVVATFSILADIVKSLGGDHVEVSTLVDWDEDAHVYRPSPQDVKLLSGANILLMNGLGFEGWLFRLVEASDFDGTAVTASAGVEPIYSSVMTQGHSEGHDHDHHGHGHGHGQEEKSLHHTLGKAKSKLDGRVDPHAWHSLSVAKQYVENIGKALITIDPAHRSLYVRNTENYIAKIDALIEEYRQELSGISPSQRKIVVPHNAFAYLAKDFGLEVHSLQGLSTGGETSASQLVQIVRRIRELGIKAIFEENVSDNRLIKVVQQETGLKFGGELISGALSHNLAPTYLDMMSYNLSLIGRALKD